MIGRREVQAEANHDQRKRILLPFSRLPRFDRLRSRTRDRRPGFFFPYLDLYLLIGLFATLLAAGCFGASVLTMITVLPVLIYPSLDGFVRLSDLALFFR